MTRHERENEVNETVQLERRGALATLTLNRPAALNALDVGMMQRLVQCIGIIAGDSSVRCVLLRGAGAHFMAGGDLRTFHEQLERRPEDRSALFTEMALAVHVGIEQLQRLAPPVVASVHGAVAGFGLSLVAACDLAIAADDARFTSAYRNIGLSPDGGATYTLPRTVGLKRAMEILLLAERFDAQRAVELGLVNRVVPAAELAAATDALVQSLLDGPPVALARIKRLLLESRSHTLSEQLRAEALAFGACSASDDFVEGIRAFLDKRPPRFGG